ncbi:hypothetical protein [Caloranaerobacter sp. DY30410]|uniref:hypothetical protein n=1 Tax=Caloranaerobacter sp. DY30410 TaxID=3238305 RepID=UPI003D03D179
MKKQCRLVLFLLLLFIVITSCSPIKVREDKVLDVDTIQKYAEERKHDQDFDYLKFVKIEMEESQILFNKTTVEQREDKYLANIVYRLKIRNITSSNIKIHYTLYIPKEFAERFVIGERVFNLFVDGVEIKPNKSLNIGHGTLIRHYKLLSQEEKEIFNKYKDIVYLVLSINDKKVYLKVTPD